MNANNSATRQFASVPPTDTTQNQPSADLAPRQGLSLRAVLIGLLLPVFFLALPPLV